MYNFSRTEITFTVSILFLQEHFFILLLKFSLTIVKNKFVGFRFDPSTIRKCFRKGKILTEILLVYGYSFRANQKNCIEISVCFLFSQHIL